MAPSRILGAGAYVATVLSVASIQAQVPAVSEREELIHRLIEASKIDSHRGLSVLELESVLGQNSRIASEDLLTSVPDRIYLYNGEFEIRVETLEEQVHHVAMRTSTGEWELIWK